MVVEHPQHRFEPARRDDRIVVEEYDVLPLRKFGAAIGSADKPQVGGVALEPDAGDGRQSGRRGLGRRIVDDDHFDHVVRSVRVQAFEARVREERLAVDRDHDRHQRRGRAVEGERDNLVLGPEMQRGRGFEALFRTHSRAHALRQSPRTLVAQDRERHRRQVRQPENSGSPSAKPGAHQLDLVARGAQWLGHSPGFGVLELVDAIARGGERRVKVRRMELHLLGLHLHLA